MAQVVGAPDAPGMATVTDADATQAAIDGAEHVTQQYPPLLQPLTWAPPGTGGYRRALPHRGPYCPATRGRGGWSAGC